LDQALFNQFPFLFYWVILFVIWSLVLGLTLGLASRIKKETLPPLPHQYFLLAICLTFLLLGTIGLAFAVAICVSLFGVTRSILRTRKNGPELNGLSKMAMSHQRVYLAACLTSIPVAYLRQWWQLQ
jgi:hypothetical protein